MGKVVHLHKLEEFGKTTPSFTSRDVVAIIGDRRYAALLLHNLSKKGRLNRVRKGFYTYDTDPTVSVFAFKPAYLGLQEALSFHGLSEQETNPVIVTTLRVRPGVREVMGGNVVVRRIGRAHFFGYDYRRYGRWFVPVSDVEKTLLDLVYFREEVDANLLAEFRKRLDKRKFTGYLRSYKAKFRKTVERKTGISSE